MNRACHPALDQATRHMSRRGSVLILVLVVAVVLAGTACAFVELIVTERAAVSASTRRAQSQETVRSGVSALLTWSEKRRLRHSAADAPDDLPQGAAVVVAETPAEGSGVVWIAPDTDDDGRPSPRLGVSDESRRLNLNALPLDRKDARRARRALMQFDGMTVHLADAILDWIDPDDEPREFGAETSYYTSLPTPYRAGNAPLRRIEDLLWVRGVSPELLFGAGAPANQVRRFGASRPDWKPSFESLRVELPWAALMTVHSAESNLRSDGGARIDVNQDDLAGLYDQIERELGPDAARFIVAYRLAGPVQGGEQTRTPDDDRDGDQAAEVADARRRAAKNRLNAQRGSSTSAAVLDDGRSTRGGLNLKYKPAYRVRSLLDLFASQVHVLVESVDTILESPWQAEPSMLQATIDQLADRLTTQPGDRIPGRVDPVSAPRPVLLGVEGMSREMAERILAARRRPPADPQRGRRNLGWLIEEGIFDVAALREIAPGLTIHAGDVHRAICLGCSLDRRHPRGLEFIADGTGSRTFVLWERPVVDSELASLRSLLPQSDERRKTR